ncbi:MAG: hypothetical protein R3B98_02875 [Hyphomonas sp.]
MDALLPPLLSAIGGIILGPILTRFTGGGATGGLLGGIVGGLAAHYGLDAAGINVLGNANGPTDMMNIVNNLLEGGVGGGVLGLVAGMLMKKKG